MQNIELIPLIVSFRAGQSKAFVPIYDAFQGLIVYYGNHLREEDAIQELTVFLLELVYTLNLDKFRQNDSYDLKRYIAASLRNKYIAMSKAKWRTDTMNVEYRDELAPCGNETAPGCQTDDKLLLFAAMLQLTHRQKQMIVYKYYYGYSVQEMADLFHVSRQSVNQLLLRGLCRLREYIEKN